MTIKLSSPKSPFNNLPPSVKVSPSGQILGGSDR